MWRRGLGIGLLALSPLMLAFGSCDAFESYWSATYYKWRGTPIPARCTAKRQILFLHWISYEYRDAHPFRVENRRVDPAAHDAVQPGQRIDLYADPKFPGWCASEPERSYLMRWPWRAAGWAVAVVVSVWLAIRLIRKGRTTRRAEGDGA